RLPASETELLLGPAQHAVGIEELKRHAFSHLELRLIGHHGRDRDIAFVVEADGMRKDRSAVAHLDPIGAAAPIHPADLDLAAVGEADPLVAVELEVAHTIKLRVVRYTGRTIAEADLGAQIDVHLGTAIGSATAERLAQTPLVERERPFHLVPHR